MGNDLPPVSSDPKVLSQHVLEHRFRLRALDDWRKETDKRVSVMESEIVTERSARQLREALAKQGRLQLTRLQQALLGLVAVGELVNLVRGFLGHG